MRYHERRDRKSKKYSRQRRWIKSGLLILVLCMAYRGMTGMRGTSPALGQQPGYEAEDAGAVLPDGDYPDSLRELAQNNPETIDFVKQFPEKKDFQGKIDVSGDLTGGIPLFLQWDERWGYRRYGGDYMAVNGCGPTCLSMVWCGLTGKSRWDPWQLAKKAEKEGYYVKGAGTSWDLMTKGATALGLKVEKLSLNEKHIVDRLQEGSPIICVVGPGDFTTQGHFLVLAGVEEDGKIIINDPNSPKRSGKRWKLKRLLKQIRNLWAYSL